MAKARIEDQSPPPSPSLVSNNGGGEEQSGTRLVTIVYSIGRDLYRAPSIGNHCWLSVTVYELPAPQDITTTLYLGPSLTADKKAWRKAYLGTWAAIIPGDQVTLPADDPMVLDYAAIKIGR